VTYSPLTENLILTSFVLKSMSEVIRYNYLYRDSGNYKKFGSKRYGNPDQLPFEEIEQNILKNLIDQVYFYPDHVGIKKFKFHRYWDCYSWYEFESIEILDNTNLSTKKLESISNLILNLHNMKYLNS